MVDDEWRCVLTRFQSSGELEKLPGCGLREGGADDRAESLSDPG